MLASAVQQSNNAQPAPNKALTQQLFPSSSPLAALNNVLKRSHSFKAPSAQQPFKLTSSSVRNTVRQPGPSNPLKRSISGISTGSATSSRLFARTISSTSAGRQHVETTQTNRGGVLGKLHENVYFDENDLLDDDDIESALEATSIPAKSFSGNLYPKLPSPPLPPVTYPSLPQLKTAPSCNVPLQSDPAIAWSSSPPGHKAPLPVSGKGSIPQQPISIDDDSEPGEEVVEEVLRPSKKRTMPWLQAQAEVVQEGSKRTKRPKIDRGNSGKEVMTPAPKGKTDLTYLWDTTASAVKAEQAKLRKQANGGKKTNTMLEEGSTSSKKAKSGAKSLSKVFLSEEQQRVAKLVVEQKASVFFTGSAGTGKSVLMRDIIHQLRQKYIKEGDRVAVTASTGLAACNIGGVTLHSFAGIGLGKEPVEQLVKKIKRSPKNNNRWQRTKVLIIDEISMVDGVLFDKLEAIARIVRKNAKPFGGIQLVITGDFFQLPPVPDRGSEAKFAFDAASWMTSVDHTIGLTHVFRQKDPEFANMLNEMRVGKLSDKSIKAFYKMSRPLSTALDVQATELFPTRHEVEGANTSRMRHLIGQSVEFKAVDGGSHPDPQQREKMINQCMAPMSLTLKKGAQVMLIKNMDDTLVNGSIGKVISFMDNKTFDHYTQHPEEFRSEDGTPEIGGPNDPGATSKFKKYAFGDGAGPGNISDPLPVVRFQISDGTSRDLLCHRESWKVEHSNGEVLASRHQIPLILAWALSIHKAQGQTLERVKVDLGKIFEKGQAYVALSRATTQEGLQISGFDPRKVQAHHKVRDFYERLYSVDKVATTKVQANDAKAVEDDFSYLDEDDLLAQAYA